MLANCAVHLLSVLFLALFGPAVAQKKLIFKETNAKSGSIDIFLIDLFSLSFLAVNLVAILIPLMYLVIFTEQNGQDGVSVLHWMSSAFTLRSTPSLKVFLGHHDI